MNLIQYYLILLKHIKKRAVPETSQVQNALQIPDTNCKQTDLQINQLHSIFQCIQLNTIYYCLLSSKNWQFWELQKSRITSKIPDTNCKQTD